MSFVTVVIVDKKNLFVKHIHWREAKALLQGSIISVEKSDGLPFGLDEGYLVVDIVERKVLSCQSAFQVPNGWEQVN